MTKIGSDLLGDCRCGFLVEIPFPNNTCLAKIDPVGGPELPTRCSDWPKNWDFVFMPSRKITTTKTFFFFFSFLPKELDMTSCFVSQTAQRVQHKLEAKPKPEKEKKKPPSKGQLPKKSHDDIGKVSNCTPLFLPPKMFSLRIYACIWQIIVEKKLSVIFERHFRKYDLFLKYFFFLKWLLQNVTHVKLHCDWHPIWRFDTRNYITDNLYNSHCPVSSVFIKLFMSWPG